MKILITKGQVKLNHYWVQLDTPNCKIIQFDCRTKWPMIEAYTGSSTSEGVKYIGVLLGVEKERSLHYDKRTHKRTEIRFSDLPKGSNKRWRMAVEVGRYTITIILFNQALKNRRSHSIVFDKEIDLKGLSK